VIARGVLFAAACGLALSSLGCSSPRQQTEPPDSTARPAPSASASAALAPSASASSASPPASVSWAGSYTSLPATFYVYDGGEWKGVHFRGDDAAVALGEGTLSLTLDTKSGSVRGTGSGSLGDIVVAGAVTGEELTFSVLRKDPTDRGLTGTGVGKLVGSSATGTIRLSRGDAHVIREAKFSLTKPGH